MNTTTRKHIFGCQLLDARQKWMIVRYIKQQNPSEKEIEGILETLKKENHYKKRAELESLKQWNQVLEKAVHETLKSKRDDQSSEQKKEDDAQADQLLSDFLNPS